MIFGSVPPSLIENFLAVEGKTAGRGYVAARVIDERLGKLQVRRTGCLARPFGHLQASKIEKSLAMVGINASRDGTVNRILYVSLVRGSR
jgi:hypothetical protein